MAPARLAAGKKGARRLGAAVAFLDETGHTFRAGVGTTWAPAGRTPVLRRRRGRREVSSVVLLTAPLGGRRARLFARHVVGTIRTPELLDALRHFHAKLGRPVILVPVILVWDRSRVHRARAVTAFVAAHPTWYRVEWLPGYAPELNPEEQCNGAVKRAMLNALPDSPEQLRALARRHFARLGRRPDLLRACFVHAGLNLT